MKKAIMAAAVFLGLSGGVYAGGALEQLDASADAVKTSPAPVAVSVPAAQPVPVSVRESYAVKLSELLNPKSCSGNFVQVNGNEPLATCDINIGFDGVVEPKHALPWVFDRDVTFDMGQDQSIRCEGGFRGDAGLRGKLQVYVSLSAWRADYPKEVFNACYEKVITGLMAKDRVLYFDVIRR